MAVQVDYRISPSDQFSVYNPDTKSNKTITYFTLLAKIRGDLNITGGGSSLPIDIVDAQDNQLLVYDSGSSTWRNETVGIFKNIRTTSSYDWEDTAFVWETVENTWETGVSSEAVVADQLEDTLYLIADSGLSIIGNPITDTIVFDNIDKGSTQNIFKNIAVSGQSTIVADSNDDTLTLVGAGGVSITTNASTDTITISTAGIVDGSGTTNYVAKWTDTDTIGDSQIFDNGTSVGIGTASPAHKVDVDGGVYADYFQLDTSYSDGAVAGKFSWNPDRETAELGLDGTVSLILGQDNLWYVKNQTGSAIPKGRAVMAVGALGASSRILVAPMVADGTISPKYLIGVTIEEIANGDDGFAVSQGKLRGFDTSGYTDGTVLYCDPNNAGQFTATEPTAPDLKLPIAFTIDSKSNGTLAIRVTAGTTIGEANDVELTSVADNDFLVYNSTSGAWENEAIGIFKTIVVSGQDDVVADAYNDTLTLVAGSNITITTNATNDTITIDSPDAGGTVTSIATTAPIQGGTITTSGTISITQSDASTDGYLSSLDWNTFNDKEPALTKGDLTESTSSVLTIGNGTGAVIGSGTTITVAQSGALTDGYLSSTDWNTFNDKQDALTLGNLTETASSVLIITGGTNAIVGSGVTIAVSQSDALTSGYLSSTDWNTFNDKEPALTKGNLTETTSAILTITGGANAVIGSGTTIAVSQADVSTSGYLSSTDWNTFNGKEPALTKGDLTEATSSVLTISNGTGSVIGSGTSIEVAQSSAAVSGYLSSTDWSTFNGKADDSFTTIAVSGQTNIVADSATDTLTFAAGSGVTIATDATTDTITISATGSGGTVTSVDLIAGTGISVSGGPITSSGSITVTNTAPDQAVVLTAGTGITTSGTYPTFTITNSAPDQPVVLTAGTGITVSGTYPTFTITNSSPSSGGTVTSVATSAPLTGGTITSTGTISITQSSALVDGYLSSTDWTTFNGKQDALTFGDLTEATSSILTITGGANAVIGSGASIAVSQATGSTNGYLSSTDWTTFNGKQDALTFTSPLVNTSGTVTINQSGTASDGYLSFTDWNAFNGKASLAFKTISVSGQSDIVADAADDTLTVAQGDRIEITTNATTDTLTITHGTASGADFTTAQDFKDRVEADGGTFEAVGDVAVALGILSSAAASTSSDNADGVVLQNIAVDSFGHVLGYSSIDLDDRYYTETEVDALFALETLDTVTDRGATTTNSITIGGLTVDTSTLVVDSVNNRVVIGGTTASYPLHVKTQVSNVSIYTEYDIAAYSDARVKEDVITISGALDKVTSMRGVTYKRIGLDSDKRFMGVIAQEVLPHAPEVVHQDEDGMYSVSYQNMVGLLIEAMKEQQQQIEELKQQLKTLSK